MNIIYLMTISSLGTTLIHVSDIYILVRKLISKKTYVIMFFSFFALMFSMVIFNIPALLFVLLLVNSLILVKASSKVFTIFLYPFLYILNCFLSYVVSIPIVHITGRSIDELNRHVSYLLLCFALIFLISIPILLILRKLFYNRLLLFFDRLNPRLIIIATITLTVCATLIYIVCSLLDTKNISYKDFIVLLSFIILFSLLTLGMIFVLLKTVKNNFETQKKVEYLENMNKYTENLEVMYNNLRSFKHDYVNIMASMTAYLDENKYEELKAYFHGNIIPMQKNLTQNNDTINRLQNLKIIEIKSILYTKVLLAMNQNINTVVDIPDEITSVNIDTVDLTRILGIYMDNAIEASMETDSPVINVNIGNIDGDIVIIISNNFVDKGLSISQMQKKNITTKGEGHGIGLANVSEILKKYDNIFHDTSIDGCIFTQQLRISQ